MTARVRFFGHACFGIDAGEGARLCVDPFEPGGFGGSVRLRAPRVAFDAWVATHDHLDHSAGHVLAGQVPRLRPPFSLGALRVDSTRVAHDEHGGRVRGGFCDALRIAAGDRTVVHVGDLGERPTGALLVWLRAAPIDVLILPVGGYFTLGPDGAAEVAAVSRARVIVPCHSADDGVALPELGPRDAFLRRFESDVCRVSHLDLDALPDQRIAVLSRS